jgi:hypothetical protein
MGAFILLDLGGKAFVVDECFKFKSYGVGDFPIEILGPLGPS